MKKFRSAIGITLFCTQLCFAMPIRAAGTGQVEFYCAPSDNMFPTTYAKTSRKQVLALVTWRSSTKAINRQRCNTASQRFQAAWNKGSLDQLMAGKDNNGAGIICGLSYRENKCDRSNTLFSLSKVSDAQDIIDKLKNNMRGSDPSSPIFQGSDRHILDFQKLLQTTAAKTINWNRVVEFFNFDSPSDRLTLAKFAGAVPW